MIDIKFLGGLGNQMFQYALYLSMREQFPDYEIRLDYDSYKYVQFHNGFELDKVFLVDLNTDIREDYSFLERKYYKLKVNLKRFYFSHLNKRNFFEDRLGDFKPNTHYFLRGTWDNEKFFIKYRDLIRKQLRFNLKNLSESVKLKSVHILNDFQESVCLHVRRGDYLNTTFISLADTDYYMKALDVLDSRINLKQAKLYIFSDDIEWCKSNLKFIHSYSHEFIGGNKSYEDMFLISKCKNIIIANSTFSWWGAYLSDAKHIICPKYTYVGQTEVNDYPQGWVMI